jgi:hypothetical protein
MAEDGKPSFKALLTLPELLTCLLRLKPDAPPPDNGHVHFEWCGREEGEGEIEYPLEDYIGWLKMDKADGRVEGMIETKHGEFLFNGPRVSVDVPVIEYEWEDFSFEEHEAEDEAKWGPDSEYDSE